MEIYEKNIKRCVDEFLKREEVRIKFVCISNPVKRALIHTTAKDANLFSKSFGKLFIVLNGTL